MRLFDKILQDSELTYIKISLHEQNGQRVDLALEEGESACVRAEKRSWGGGGAGAGRNGFWKS